MLLAYSGLELQANSVLFPAKTQGSPLLTLLMLSAESTQQ